jgi:hypothetical protein
MAGGTTLREIPESPGLQQQSDTLVSRFTRHRMCIMIVFLPSGQEWISEATYRISTRCPRSFANDRLKDVHLAYPDENYQL